MRRDTSSRIGRAATGKVQFEFTDRLDFFLKSAGGISQSTAGIIAQPARQVKPHFDGANSGHGQFMKRFGGWVYGHGGSEWRNNDVRRSWR
jgi:hypothetical protein